jgi:membrane associated rhomboid family serine protease
MSYASADTSYESPRLTPAVQGIIAVNVGIAFLQVTGLWSAVEMQTLLGFQWGDLQGAWWKALTYMFVHGGFLHLAGNMYMLWLFGPRLEHAWSTRAFLRFYVICGLGGWLLHVLFVQRGVLMGASAAVYGIMFAYARQWKDEEMYLLGVVPVRVRWLVAGYVAYDLTMGVLNAFAQVDTSVAHYAHLGGVLAALLYLKTPTAQSLEKLRQRVNQVPDVPDEPPRAVPRQAPRPPRERGSEADEVVAKSKALATTRPPQLPRKPAVRPPAVPVATGSELDALLDKISAQGMDSLTREERDRLEAAARKLKDEG